MLTLITALSIEEKAQNVNGRGFPVKLHSM